MLLDSIGLDYGIWIDLNFILFWVLKEFNCYFNYDMFFYSLFDWIWDPIYGPQRKHYWYVEFDEEYWIENFLSNLVMIPRILRWCSYAFPLFFSLATPVLEFYLLQDSVYWDEFCVMKSSSISKAFVLILPSLKFVFVYVIASNGRYCAMCIWISL